MIEREADSRIGTNEICRSYGGEVSTYSWFELVGLLAIYIFDEELIMNIHLCMLLLFLPLSPTTFTCAACLAIKTSSLSIFRLNSPLKVLLPSAMPKMHAYTIWRFGVLASISLANSSPMPCNIASSASYRICSLVARLSKLLLQYTNTCAFLILRRFRKPPKTHRSQSLTRLDLASLAFFHSRRGRYGIGNLSSTDMVTSVRPSSAAHMFLYRVPGPRRIQLDLMFWGPSRTKACSSSKSSQKKLKVSSIFLIRDAFPDGRYVMKELKEYESIEKKVLDEYNALRPSPEL